MKKLSDPVRLLPWLVRAMWVVLPVTAGPAFASALHRHSHPVQTVAAAVLWLSWATVLIGTLVPHPLGLTALRVVAPAAVVAAALAAATGRPSPLADLGALASTLLALAVALAPETGRLYVNGPAYPNERRYPLRIPGLLLMGPLELAWAVTIAVPVTGALLLASRAWVAGGVVLAVGLPVVAVLARSLHNLSRRWVVFVPAGLVLHDPLALVDPVLIETRVIEVLRPAPADSDSLDLTQGAPGLALELVLRQKVPMVLMKPGQRGGESGSSARLLFTPTRPGALLADAGTRRLPVG
jgi:hypothetical protein